ncbi:MULTISPECIES: hypothetical protein [Rhizobium]|uniref:Mannose-6-phosphate isomerase, cupin superfamily n=1 Tax=Rhizobium miluonense TaxID=411945 RepID=A0A1C3W833_9HYPH|nr:hypothetical protein [Rhizobium miluonense]SCB36035.1 hypothetical protein GA0061102_102456 [Rhizobium miluonense]
MILRPVSLSYFSKDPARRSVIRGQNFSVECVRGANATEHMIHSDRETILILAESAATLITDFETVDVASRSIAIAPAGTLRLRLPQAARCFVLTTGRTDIDPRDIINASDYDTLDERVLPVVKPMERLAKDAKRVHTYQVDEVPFPDGNPRLKFFQSETMSINWVEYDGQRDRTKLSPHAHEDFEQGSLAIAGDFMHHIRTPWASNAEHWRDDQHIKASAESMLIIPPELIHTTEGVGTGQHILIDVFAPPRTDFIAKGWVFNASDYRA